MKINIYNEAKYNLNLIEENKNISNKFNWIKDHNNLSETSFNSAHFAIYASCGYTPDIIQKQISDIRNKYFNIKPILFLLTDDVIEHVPLIDDGNIYITTAFNPQSKVKHQHSGAYPCSIVKVKKFGNENWNRPRSTLASFAGSLTTHPLRHKLKEIESDNIKIYGMKKNWWSISKEEKEERDNLFMHNMHSSLFALCPRGNGPSSIRLVEAIQNGCLPVAIDDYTKILDDDLDFCIRKSFNEISNLESDLLRIKNNKEELKRRFKLMEHFVKTKLCSNPGGDLGEFGDITYGHFIYDKCKSYLAKNKAK